MNVDVAQNCGKPQAADGKVVRQSLTSCNRFVLSFLFHK